MKKGPRLETDVLIIGCGIAGATSALELAKQGLNVLVVTREKDMLQSLYCPDRTASSRYGQEMEIDS